MHKHRLLQSLNYIFLKLQTNNINNQDQTIAYMKALATQYIIEHGFLLHLENKFK